MGFLKIFLVGVGITAACAYRRWRPSLPLPLLLFLASVFLSRAYWEIAGSTVRLEQLMALLLFAYFLLDILRRKVHPRLHWHMLLLLALFPLMLLSSFLASPASWLSLKKSLLYLPYLLAFVAMVHYLSSAEKLHEALRAFYVFGAGAVFISLLALYLLFLDINVGMVRLEYGSHWLRGTMVIPNIMGSTAVIVFLVALVRLTGKAPGKKKWRALDWAVLAASFAVVLTSYTRAAWIAVLAGMIFVACWRWKTLALRSAVAILLMLVGSGAFVAVTTNGTLWKNSDRHSAMTMNEFGEPEQRVGLGEELEKNIPKDKKNSNLRDPSPMTVVSIDYVKKVKMLFGNNRRSRWLIFVTKEALNDWRHSPIIGRGSDSLMLTNHMVLQKHNHLLYIPITAVAILHDWGALGLIIYGLFLLVALVRLTRTVHSTIEEKWKNVALTLLVVLITTTFMYQISTTMQLSIFWCLMAFYAAACSPEIWPVGDVSVKKA